jgi:hypothetical protein
MTPLREGAKFLRLILPLYGSFFSSLFEHVLVSVTSEDGTSPIYLRAEGDDRYRELAVVLKFLEDLISSFFDKLSR